jgi:hypothetical protein
MVRGKLTFESDARIDDATFGNLFKVQLGKRENLLMTKKIKFCRLFSILYARKSQHDFDSFLFTRHSFFMCHMLPEVMHEPWILFKNITKLHFLESQPRIELLFSLFYDS